MTHRAMFSFLLLATLALGSTIPVSAQGLSKTTPAAKKWSAGRTPNGQPDLEGVWDAASMTPLERPVELGNKEFYTPEEIAAYEKKRAHDLDRDRRDGSAEADLGRAYNDGWFDRGAHFGQRQTHVSADRSFQWQVPLYDARRSEEIRGNACVACSACR
jgi:hypothetical protein